MIDKEFEKQHGCKLSKLYNDKNVDIKFKDWIYYVSNNI